MRDVVRVDTYYKRKNEVNILQKKTQQNWNHKE